MSPRVQAERIQNRLRTPRIPKFSSHSILYFEALAKRDFLFDQSFFIAKINSLISALIEKRDFLFDQGFFIAHVSRVADLFRIAVFKLGDFKKSAFKTIFPQFYICFSTSVL